jgi:hypothetical protein
MLAYCAGLVKDGWTQELSDLSVVAPRRRKWKGTKHRVPPRGMSRCLSLSSRRGDFSLLSLRRDSNSAGHAEVLTPADVELWLE